MGKKNKIRKSFAGWDDVSPEEQIENGEEFYNINENNIENILELDKVPKKTFRDKNTGLEAEIAQDIIKNFGHNNDTEVNNDTIPDDYVEYQDLTEDNNTEEDEPVEEFPSFEEVYEGNNTSDVVETEYKNTSFEEPTDTSDEDDDTSRFETIRKLSVITNRTVGVAKFDDEIAPFSINIHQSMLTDLVGSTDGIDGLMNQDVISLLEKALIVNRYPAALFKKDEFVERLQDIKGSLKQNDSKKVVFVDVLGEYIAVYFVYAGAIERFTSLIPSITNDNSDKSTYNIWFDLATILDNEAHSFSDEENFVELFYNSSANDNDEKTNVVDYIKSNYVEDNDESFVDNLTIISRDAVTEQYEKIVAFILDDSDDESDEDDDFEEDDINEDDLESSDDSEDMLRAAIQRNEDQKSNDGSMKVAVHHKGQ